MGLESGDLFLDGAEVRVAAIVSLDIGVDSPVFGLYELLNDEGVGIGVSLDVTKEPGGKGFGDVVVVDARGGVEVLNEYGIVGSSSGAHDSTLVDILDIAGLHREPVDDDGEVGHLPTILLKSLGAFDGVSIFIGTEAVLEIFDGGSTTSSDCFEVSTVLGLLRLESFRKSTIPSCLGRRQGVVNALLAVISLLSKGGDEVLVSVFTVGGALQLVDSRASDVLGQGSNGLGGELVLPVLDEGEGALGVDDGGLGHFQDFG